MRLYVLRHAHAEDKVPGSRDADRRLTPKGQAQARAVAELFDSQRAPAEVRPRRIICSHAIRARQTAEPLGAALGIAVEYDTRLGLDAGTEDAPALVAELLDADDVCVLIGHNPTLEDLIAALGGKGELRKAELVVMDVRGPARAPRGREIGRSLRGE